VRLLALPGYGIGGVRRFQPDPPTRLPGAPGLPAADRPRDHGAWGALLM